MLLPSRPLWIRQMVFSVEGDTIYLLISSII